MTFGFDVHYIVAAETFSVMDLISGAIVVGRLAFAHINMIRVPICHFSADDNFTVCPFMFKLLVISW